MDDLPPIGDIGELLDSYISDTSQCNNCGRFPTVNYYGPYRVQRHGWWHVWSDLIRKEPHFVIEGTMEVDFCDDWEPTPEDAARADKMMRRILDD